jgi:type I restriction enzyme, S subunit
MKLETFFEKFDQFANTPDAVMKMRELVLELSATGRLIPEALERPVEEDSKLMGSIVELVMGQAPAGDEYNTEGRGTVFVKVGEFGPLYPREEVWTTNPLKSAKTGDVLVCVVGATVGKLNLAIDCAIGRSVAAIRPSAALETKFLYYSLIPYTLRLRRNSRGSAQGVIGKAELNAVRLWLPSLAVQKRIVAKVDELMALCDRLEAQQQERETRHAALTRASLARFADAPTPTNLNLLFHPSYTIPPADLRKSIVTLAIQGKLVPQDPNDEPASTSVDLVSKEAKKAIRDGIIRRHGLAEPPDDSELPELSPGWRWTRLAEITRPVPYAIKRGPFGSAIRKDIFVPNGFKVYEQQHAISGDFTKGSYYINEAKFEELSAFELHPNEILVSCSGTVGKVSIVPTNIQRGVINQALLKLSLHQFALLNEYFLILFPAFFMETDTLTNLSGTAQKNIPGMDVLRAMPFPLPPLAEQRRIVAKVDALMALVDRLETQLAASRATAAKLLDAIVVELTTITNHPLAMEQRKDSADIQIRDHDEDDLLKVAEPVSKFGQ